MRVGEWSPCQIRIRLSLRVLRPRRMAFKLAKTIPLVQSDSSVLAGIPILFLCWISLLLGGTVRRRQLSRKSDGGLQGKWSQGFRIGREMGHRSLPDKVAEEMTVELRLARIFQSA